MTAADPIQATVRQAAETLVEFSVDRQDLGDVLLRLPASDQRRLAVVEYELRLLKILATGWALAYFMADRPERAGVEARFWEGVETLARNVSELTLRTTGRNVDYFHTLRERLQTYVAALGTGAAGEPAAAIGPEFARACGCSDDVHVIMAGSRIFQAAVQGVHQYLARVAIVPTEP